MYFILILLYIFLTLLLKSSIILEFTGLDSVFNMAVCGLTLLFSPLPSRHIYCPRVLVMTNLLAMSLSSCTTCSLFTTYLLIILLTLPRTSHCLNNSLTTTPRRPARQLSVDYYAKTCPHVDQLVSTVTTQQFKEAPISGPATIRLFFHDCFVEVSNLNSS